MQLGGQQLYVGKLHIQVCKRGVVFQQQQDDLNLVEPCAAADSEATCGRVCGDDPQKSAGNYPGLEKWAPEITNLL